MSGGPRDFTYITPEELVEKHPALNLDEFKKRAAKPETECEVCGLPAWKYGDTGMCFSCTTGESDASGDYELIQERTA